MKHIVFIFLCLAPISAFRAAEEVSTLTTMEMVPFKSDRFTLHYLPSWRLKQKEDAIFFIDRIYPSGSGATFEVGSKKFTGDVEQIKAVIQNPEKEYTDFMLEEARKKVPDTKLISHHLTTLGGFPARLFGWEFTKRNLDQVRTYGSITMICYRDGYIYRVIFESSSDDFKFCMTEVKQMIATFTFK